MEERIFTIALVLACIIATYINYGPVENIVIAAAYYG